MALYHKHRPQNFSTVIGQEHIVQTISNQISNDNVAHAYLFSGPRGVGKTTIARLLAKAVNCPNRKPKTFEPCNKCQHCEETTTSRSIDVIEMDAASHTGVDNVRENIIDNAQFKPTKSKYKVFIVDEVHMLSTSAFNALLKTLEEPPAHVIFILATTEMHKLPETIVSRCQRFDFKKIPFETLKKHLQKISKMEEVKIDKEVIERIINKSDGCARDAVSLLDQIMAVGEKQITEEIANLVLPTTNVEKTLEMISSLVKKDLKNSIEMITKLVDDGINVSQFNYDLIELLHVMMIDKSGAKTAIAGTDLSEQVKKEIQNLNKSLSSLEIVRLIDLFIKRGQQIKSAPMLQLPIEMAIFEWCANGKLVGCEEDNNPNSSKTEKNGAKQKTDSDANQEKKSLSERVKDLVARPEIKIEQIEGGWDKFLEKVEQEYPSLAFILKMAKIKKMENNTLELAVGFSFHQDKLMEKKNQKNLESILSEIIESKIKLGVVVETKSSSADDQDEELKEIASSLGGEIVN